MTGSFSLDLFAIFGFFIPNLACLVLFLLLLRSFFKHSAFVRFQDSVKCQDKADTTARISPCWSYSHNGRTVFHKQLSK